MQIEFLTDLEVLEIEKFNANPVLVDAVKKVIFAFVNERGVAKKGKKAGNIMYNGALGLVSQASTGKTAISNEELGQDLRAYYHAIGLLENGFQELALVKKQIEEENKEINEAI